MSHTPFIFGLAAFSGAGKTTLAEKLISYAAAKGLVISSIKHAHHKFEPDVVGKDSWRHRQAGARQTSLPQQIGQPYIQKILCRIARN